jgi:hypothetical protein
MTPAALSLFFNLAGAGFNAAGEAAAVAGEAGEGGAAGRGLFGFKAPPPSGPVSGALREQMLAAAKSPWFRFKANVWAWATGRGAIDWEQFMARLESAEFREFATWREASRSLGWAGRASAGSPQWLFGVPRLGRNLPLVGRSLMFHELFHGLQDLKYGMFAANEAAIPIKQAFLIEGAAHLFGGTLVGTLPYGMIGGIGITGGYELWVLGDALRIMAGW